MNQDAYKTILTPRGHTYSYFFSPAKDTKPYILFIHGFPCTSQDWVLQIPHFVNKGYGVIAPDTLGYGKTSKPADVSEYTMAGIAEDVVGILDAEKIGKAIVVGHDWGSWIASRMLEKHTDRFLAVGFLALGYVPPQPDFDFEQALEGQRKMIGSELFGYWDLLGAPDAASVIEKNIDSFYDIIFGDDPSLWMDVLAPSGKLRSFVSSGSRRDKRAPYLSAETIAAHQKRILEGGFTAPCSYYRAKKEGYNNKSESDIPPFPSKLKIPIFLGTALKDFPGSDKMSVAMTSPLVEPELLTVHNFDTAHWIMYEKPEELRDVLGGWVEKVC